MIHPGDALGPHTAGALKLLAVLFTVAIAGEVIGERAKGKYDVSRSSDSGNHRVEGRSQRGIAGDASGDERNTEQSEAGQQFNIFGVCEEASILRDDSKGRP